MRKINWAWLLGCILGVELIGTSGSLATLSQITTWYAGLHKPPFNPPNSVFGPVWAILFALVGVALVTQGGEKRGHVGDYDF